MLSNNMIFACLICVELSIIAAVIIFFVAFKVLSQQIKDTRCDYNFRQSKLEEIFENKNEINQLITGQYKLILEQYQAILEYWKKSSEIVMIISKQYEALTEFVTTISKQYEALEGRYSDIYEEYHNLSNRLDEVKEYVKPVEIDLDEPSSIYWDPFYDRAEIDFSEEEEKTDES